MPDIIGNTAVITHTVEQTDLATYWNNDTPVLATPVLLWLSELAAMQAVDAHLPVGHMTVGTAHNCQHLAPTPVGFNLTLRATVKSATRKHILFDVEATDGIELILSGTHTRAVVDRRRFEKRINDKSTGRQ